MIPIPGQTTLIAAAVALFLGLTGGGYVAWQIQQVRIDEQKIAALQGVNDAWKIGWLRRDAQASGITFANRSNADDQAKINGNTQEIIRYVPKYISSADDTACRLPPGFSRVLDAALLGVAPDQLPADAREPSGPAAALTLSRAVPVLAQSLGDYAGVRARLLNGKAAWEHQATIDNAKPVEKSWWERNNPF